MAVYSYYIDMKTFIVCCLVILVCGVIGSTCDMNPDNSERKKIESEFNSNMRDYQIEVHNDSTVIFDGNKRIGVMQYDKFSVIDSIVDADNL